MKKNKITSIISLCLVLALSFACTISASAAACPVSIFVDGEAVVFSDNQPYIDTSCRTMVPIQFVTEALGANVRWNENLQTAIIEKGDIRMEIIVGRSDMKVVKDNVIRTVRMDTSAVLKNSRVYVPIRFVAEAFGAEVEYCSVTQSIEINNNTSSGMQNTVQFSHDDFTPLIEDTLSTIASFEDEVIYELIPSFYKTCEDGFCPIDSPANTTTVSMVKHNNEFMYSIEDLYALIPSYVNASLDFDSNGDFKSYWVKNSPFADWVVVDAACNPGNICEFIDGEHFVSAAFVSENFSDVVGVAASYGKVGVLSDISTVPSILDNIPAVVSNGDVHHHSFLLKDEYYQNYFVAALWNLMIYNEPAYEMLMKNCEEIVLFDSSSNATLYGFVYPSSRKICIADSYDKGTNYCDLIAGTLAHEATHIACYESTHTTDETCTVLMEMLTYYRMNRSLAYIEYRMEKWLKCETYKVGAENALTMMKLLEPEYFGD